MSVYSGFATRQQEHRYNECLQALLTVLLKRILKFYNQQPCEQSRFIDHLISLHDKMYKMEQNKYMQPHYSYLLKSTLLQISNSQTQIEQPLQSIYFDAPIPTVQIVQSRQKIKNNAKINSIDSFLREQQQTQLASKQPIQNIRTTQSKFRSTIKGNTIEKIHYFTPPQKNSQHQQKEYQLPTFNRQDFFKSDNKMKLKANIPKVPKIDKPIRTDISQPLSPREFLRQTMMGKQSNNSFAGLRTKQRHQKRVN